MSKLELVIMAGAESKAFLANLTTQLDRAEQLLIQVTNELKVERDKVETPKATKTTKAATTTKQTDKVKAAAAAETEVEETETAEVEETESEGDDLDFLNDEKEVEAMVNVPDVTDVRKIMKDFAVKYGKEKTLVFLGKFKATAIPEIKKADYAKVIELATKALKK